MKKLMVVVVLVSIFILLTAAFVSAEEGEQVGSCPDGFDIHMVDHHEDHGDHQHHHIGTDADQNGDGWICFKHVGADGNNHVHIDNNIPLH